MERIHRNSTIQRLARRMGLGEDMTDTQRPRASSQGRVRSSWATPHDMLGFESAFNQSPDAHAPFFHFQACVLSVGPPQFDAAQVWGEHVLRTAGDRPRLQAQLGSSIHPVWPRGHRSSLRCAEGRHKQANKPTNTCCYDVSSRQPKKHCYPCSH